MEGPVTRIVREQSCLLMDAAANNPQWKLPNVFALSLPWDDESESLVGKLEAGVFDSPPDVYEETMVYLMDIWHSSGLIGARTITPVGWQSLRTMSLTVFSSRGVASPKNCAETITAGSSIPPT